jgi:hypothetical protein
MKIKSVLFFLKSNFLIKNLQDFFGDFKFASGIPFLNQFGINIF